MHAVMNTDDGIRVVDADEPSGAGVRLSVASAGICGTDVNLVAAGISGFIYGHEFAGVDDSGTGYFVEPIVYGGKGNTGAVTPSDAPNPATPHWGFSATAAWPKRLWSRSTHCCGCPRN